MSVWLVCFVLLFAVAELFNWVKQFNLPLPVSILAGALLAVASNYNKIFGSYLGDGNMNTIVEQYKVEQPKLAVPTQANPISFSAVNSIQENQAIELE